MHFPIARVAGLVVATFLGTLLVGGARVGWANYWLLNDGRQTNAIVASVTSTWSSRSKDVQVDYHYWVDRKEYSGSVVKNRHNPPYGSVHAGESMTVYVSFSHPWLSSIEQPQAVIVGGPFMLLALLFFVLAVITVVNPRAKWAFRINGGRGA
jgi:Protein of unknown function (DUF3592)